MAGGHRIINAEAGGVSLVCPFPQLIPDIEEPNIDQYRTNEQIRITPVRVIDAEGNQLGVIPTKEALEKAKEAELDLVEVAPDASPPVCRIMDYGKFRYERSKKSHKSKSHQTKLKEIRVRPKTGQHDIDFKVKKAIGFLEHKDKVQVTVMFRGRELAHIEEGRKVMQGIIARLEEHGKVESAPSTQSRRMTCTIAPR
ncbi:MAG: translation initiation factor IF-3 [Pirellulaceae bacterium]